MKRFISLILSITIILGMFSGVGITVSAQTSTIEEYRLFQAGAYASSFESNYVGTGASSYARNFLEGMQSDTILMAEINAWETLHIASSPSYSLESGMITKYDYYKTVLFDLLTGKEDNQSASTFEDQYKNLYKQVNNSYTSYIVSTAKKIADIENVEVDELISVTHGNFDELLKISRYSEIAGTADQVLDILSYCENMYEAIKVMATYNALTDLNDGTREILTYISNDKSNPVDLRDAAQSLILCFENSYQSVINSMLIGECYILKDVASMFIDFAWYKIVETIPGGAAVLIGLKGARAIVNILMSEDDKVSAYYQIEASVICEDALISAMQGLRAIYNENISYKNAATYMRAIEMYKDTVLLGFDYSTDLLKVIYESGFNTLFGSYDEAITIINDIESLKDSKICKYSAFENSVYRQYVALYLTDYDAIMNKLNDQKISITSMSVKQIKDICLGDEGAVYDFFSVLYLPDNHTEFAVGESVTSSDESILKTDNENGYIGGYLTAVGEGTCTLTFTTYDLKHSTSIEVTVKANDDFDVDDFLYIENDDENTITITKYIGSDKKIVVPSVINGKAVTKIRYEAFKGCQTALDITISSGITSIGWETFAYCSNLKSISLPKTIETIGMGAFTGCESLEKVNIESLENWCSIDFGDGYINGFSEYLHMKTNGYRDANNQSNPLYYAHNLYISDNLIEDLKIPETVTEIKSSAFVGGNFKSVEFHNNLTNIGRSAFENNSGYESIIVPEKLYDISCYTFYDCDDLRYIVFLSENKLDLNVCAVDLCSRLEHIFHSGSGYTRTTNYAGINLNCSPNISQATYHKNITYTGNEIKIINRNEAACADGSYDLYCNICEETFATITIKGTGHNYYAAEIIETSCTQQGYTLYKCERCDSQYKGSWSTLPKGHTNVLVETVAPTCTEKGYDLYRCSACQNETKSNYVNAAHTYVATSVVEATCLQSGHTRYECEVCGSSKVSDYVSALGHNGQYVKTISPSCTEVGYDVYNNCERCGESYKLNEVEATGHKNEVVNIVNPSCDTDGYTVYRCSVCGYESVSDYTWSQGHKIEVVNVVKPKCTASGYTEYCCSFCGYEHISNYTDALGHNFANGVCSICGVDERWEYHILTWSGDGYYWGDEYVGEKFVCIEGYSGNVVDLVIPEYIEGYPVQMIDYEAFLNHTEIETVTIPKTLTHMEPGAFEGCTALSEVHISDLAAWCLVKCSDSFTNPLRYADGLYLNGELLTDIVVPEGVESIGAEIFANYGKLNSITIPSSVKKIERNAFAYCDGLTNVYISDIAAWCSVEFESILANPLFEAKNLYLRGELLTSVIIPEGVTEISSCAFSGCNSLTNVSIPDSVTSIGEQAFYDCYSLINMVIPKSVTSIGRYAFDGCNSLWHVLYTGTEEEWNNIAIGNDNISLTETIHHYDTFGNAIVIETLKTCTQGTIIKGSCSYCNEDVYETDGDTGEHSFVDGACTVCNTADCWEYYFSSWDNGICISGYSGDAKDVVIPETLEGIPVVSIGYEAFYNNDVIETVCIPDAIKYIGSAAFHDCDNLVCVEFAVDSKLTSLPTGTFSGCDGLKSITLPDSITGIYASFQNCSGLEYIKLPENLKEIGWGTFSGCDRLTDVFIPLSVTKVDENAFSSCNNLWHILYAGDEEAWNNISINSSGNYYLTNTTKHFNADGNEVLFAERIEPTCTEQGYDIHKCSICESTNNRNYQEPLGHSNEVISVVEPTCSNKGYTKYRCSVCEHESNSDYTDALGHNFVNGTCDVCGMLEEDCIESEHNYANNCDEVWTISKENAKRIAITFSGETYTETNYDYIYIYDGEDNLIGKYSGSELSSKRIVVHSSVVKIRLTSDYSGTYYGFSLTNVEAYYEECLHPNTTTVNELSATCTEDGYTGDVYCVECDFVITLGSSVPAVGHQGTFVKTVSPTCAEEGYDIFHCSTCDSDYYKNYINALGHSNEQISIVSPTCYEQGYTLYKCSVCEHETKDNYIDYNGHTFEDGVCLYCNVSKDDLIESEHDYPSNCDKTWTINKAGAKQISITFSKDTYTESGYDFIYIYDGNDNFIGEYSGSELASKQIVVDGDTIKIRLTSDSSVTEYGFAIIGIKAVCADDCHSYDNACDTECNICDFKREIEHSFEWIIDKAATCKDGIKHEKCSVCHTTRNENTKIDATGNHIYGDDHICDVCGFGECDIAEIFPDTDNSAWYSDAVAYAYSRGIIKGYQNGKFGASDGIQRQDFLVMLARFDGVDLTEYGYDCNMPDVARNSYYEAAVNWGVENGITTGYIDGTFGVGDMITREQIVTFLYRYAQYKGLNVYVSSSNKREIIDKYTDYKKVSDFSKEAILWAIDRGVIKGKTSTTIVPQGNAQRCEVAQIMYNIFLNEIF